MLMDEPEREAQRDAVMDPKRFLSHTVRVHEKRQHLTQVFDRKTHWVFAMTHECGAIALRLNALHKERCGTHFEIVVACCLDHVPAFLLFPKENLSYDEITELLDVHVAGSQAEAEQMHYFTLAMQDPTPLSEALNAWVHIDHLLS
jgi:hypothetical protein